ncbi:MAG: hypothetical protein NC453_26430, partial [Muribaculum sp.]|nr:hypothetical protein [Muribaculum sp.]
MRKSHLLSGLIALIVGCLPSFGVPVQITMNSTSQTMTLVSEDGTSVDVGTPTKKIYNLDIAPGKYTLTGFEAKGTNNGSIVIVVEDKAEQQDFKVLTNSIYATNKDENNQQWKFDVDYTADILVVDREGNKQAVVVGGSSKTDGRKCALALSGHTLYITLYPSQEHSDEGYVQLDLSGTVTASTIFRGDIPKGSEFTFTLPMNAGIEVAKKNAHFTDFSPFQPVRTEDLGDTKNVTYRLGVGQLLNYRIWKKDGITMASTFYATENGHFTFTENDFSAYNPKQINHDVNANGGYETGDIYVNINERGHLVMNVGDTFDAHAMRNWQLTDTETNNYFFEPDFHYSVIDLNGNPSNGIIEISTDETTSSWRTIKAVGTGTAIVLVSYDAICLTDNWMGGKFWGAIWPENTAVYVVTVGESSGSIEPNMVINEKYNIGEDGTALLKMSGKNIDAEHDVFYYLDTENGYSYTFTPNGVETVTLAYPTIGENSATYTGFGSDGVTVNPDGSYTLLLKEGRNIVKLSDAAGKSVYQVITAKTCHREITNFTHTDTDKFYPGDRVKIQYFGLSHPANKLAGIYNMSAYLTYNGVPNGTSLILGPGQYTFSSAPDAQAIEFQIPEDYDTSSNNFYIMNDGVIQVNGYGDPIGSHRYINKSIGRSPNFTAVPHKTYFGAIPKVELPIL